MLNSCQVIYMENWSEASLSRVLDQLFMDTIKDIDEHLKNKQTRYCVEVYQDMQE